MGLHRLIAVFLANGQFIDTKHRAFKNVLNKLCHNLNKLIRLNCRPPLFHLQHIPHIQIYIYTSFEVSKLFNPKVSLFALDLRYSATGVLCNFHLFSL